MSSTQIDKVLGVYRRLCQIPSLTSARIIPAPKNVITIQTVWTERNLERRAKQKFIQEFSFHATLEPLLEGFPIEVTSELLTTSSEDGKLKAILRDVTVDGKSKQFIEVWDSQHLSKSYDLSAFDVHGDVYVEPTFSAFHWSPDNKRLLYVAEKKLPKCEPFYKQKGKPKPKTDKPDDGEEPTRGTEYIYKPDWGEQLVGKHKSVVVILNIDDDSIVPVISIPDEYFPAQVIWAPNGEDIVGVAYKLKSRYLGLYACTNRESYIFHLKGTEFRKVTAEGLSCISPRLSPNGKQLIWLEREISPAHHHVHRLMRLNWDSDEKADVLVDLVKTQVGIAKGKEFYGLYSGSLPKRCWCNGSKYIFLSTPQRTNIRSYLINSETKIVAEVENPDGSSLTIADVKENFVAFVKFSLTNAPQLVIGKFDPTSSNVGDLHLHNCTNPIDIPKKENFMYEHTKFDYANGEPVKDFDFTYFGIKDGPDQSVPLIAVLHGGPHASHCNMFDASYALFTQLGFGILQINYRGSTGRGGDSIDYLLGKVGDVDVRDCITAIDTALNKYRWLDPKKVSLYGGSHGGFLGAHLSSQYPDKFKAVILLNPVIDIAAMFATTDIPDWCRAESGFSILEKLPHSSDKTSYSEVLQKMLNHSPIVHADKVKAPTLIALGSKDLRVPLSQGKLWYNRLTENGVTTRLFMYEDNHSLRKDEVEIDNNINSALWLMEHNSEESIKDSKSTGK